MAEQNQCPSEWSLGEIILQCELRVEHDNPGNEIGSSPTIPMHRAQFDQEGSDGITKVEVYWRTPGLFGEKTWADYLARAKQVL